MGDARKTADGTLADGTLDGRTLDRLYEVIESRRGADPKTSHTAKLLKKGPRKIAKKLGEEAVETVIEGVAGDRKRLAAESADLLYHLLVLWAALEARRGTSGVAEKASRPKE